MKSQKDKGTQRNANMIAGIPLGLAIGLSLGTLFGIVTDNIALGMMLVVAAGLCGGSDRDAPKGKATRTVDEEKKRSRKSRHSK